MLLLFGEYINFPANRGKRCSFDSYFRQTPSISTALPHNGCPAENRLHFCTFGFSQHQLLRIIHHLQGFIIKVLHEGLSCTTPRDLSGLWKRFYDVWDLKATLILKTCHFLGAVSLNKAVPTKAAHPSGCSGSFGSDLQPLPHTHPTLCISHFSRALSIAQQGEMSSLFPSSISVPQTERPCFLHTHSPRQQPRCSFLSAPHTTPLPLAKVLSACTALTVCFPHTEMDIRQLNPFWLEKYKWRSGRVKSALCYLMVKENKG